MADKQREDMYLDKGTATVRKKTIVIRPGGGKAVGLGIYKSSLPSPEFEVTYTPDIEDDIGLSQERLDIPGESRYMLLYQLHNFSAKTCKVTILRRQSPTAS